MKIDDLLKKLPPDNFGKGDAFEKLVKWWLQNDSVWKGLLKPSTVKLWNESPHRQGRDIGIDLTAEDYLGHVWAIQAKNWKEETSLPKSEIDKFLSASNTRKFQKRLLVTTTSSISSNAVSAMDHQEKEAKKVTIHDLRESNVEWQLYFDNPKANATKEVKIPFPHQKDAIKNTVKGLKENKRGQLIMACGSGKTITAQRIDEELESKLTLVLVPSLLLVQQTLKSWREETRKEFLSMAVCSDDTVTNDSAVGKVSDLSIPVTTDSKEIKEFLKLKGRKVIFSTYQSSSKIAKAIKGTKHKFDLVIADEAHRLAGTVDKEYGAVLQKNALPSKHYLFMTATPRIFTANVQKTASERGVEVYSMDDENTFGKQLHNYSFADAIRDGVLTDYRVVVVGVDDPMLADMIDQRELVRAGDIDTDAKTLASHIGLAKAMRDYQLNRVISFHSRIKSAKNFAETHPRIRDWMKEPNIKSTNLTTLTISGQDSSDARKTVLDQLKEVDKDSQGLVTNARCLTEGVDVPTLDGIAFIDPRASQVDIVQAVGRAIRRGGDEKKFGYIVIPIFFSQDEINEEKINESVFKPIWDVINALKSHDSKLAEEFNQLRLKLGNSEIIKNMNFPSKIILELPISLESDVTNKIKTLFIQRNSSNIYELIARLIEFSKEYGHVKIPFDFKTLDGFNLGLRTRRIRQLYKTNQLLKSEVDELEKIQGWYWDLYEYLWDLYYSEVSKILDGEVKGKKVEDLYKKDFIENELKLGQWVGFQRTKYKKNELDNYKINKLNDLKYWTWDARESWWQESYFELVEYVNEHGNARVGDEFISKNNINLGKWVGKQRQFYLKNKISKERILLLEKLPGWTWDAKGAIWNEWFEELREFLNHNSIEQISQTDDRTKLLAYWTNRQKDLYVKGKLEADRIEKLETLDQWYWLRKKQNSFERFVDELKKFVDETGTFPTSLYRTPDGFTLGIRYGNYKRRKMMLSKSKQMQLESIPGWEWDLGKKGKSKKF